MKRVVYYRIIGSNTVIILFSVVLTATSWLSTRPERATGTLTMHTSTHHKAHKNWQLPPLKRCIIIKL